jgi:hypothetical protein
MKTYTFHNRGSIKSFNPNARSGNGTLLDLHMDLVRSANDRAVFILDHKGREVDTTTVTPLAKVA